MPFTNGSSGPTTTKSICSDKTVFFIASKSFTPTEIFLPQEAVPALPGAINSCVQCVLALNERAKACSRPPDPNNKIRIRIGSLIRLITVAKLVIRLQKKSKPQMIYSTTKRLTDNCDCVRVCKK